MFGMVPFRRNNNSIAKRGDSFSDLIDNFFNDDFFVPMVPFKNNFNVDLKETENEYVVEADLPGVNKDAVNVEIDVFYIYSKIIVLKYN